jgi:hypothetical protein
MDKNLTDGEIVILLHKMARETDNHLMREIADRFSELAKEHKQNVLDGLFDTVGGRQLYH